MFGSVRYTLMDVGKRSWTVGVAVAWSAIAICTANAQGFEGARMVSFYGYDDCIELYNADTSVILCPAAGGRVLRYALNGTNALYLPDGDEGWVWDGDPKNRGPMHAGRFDIGPEQIVPRRLPLWQGKWQGKFTGDRSAEMRSPVDPGTGVFLVRSFELDERSSRLTCTQTIVNASDEPVEYCHWSRTFAVGGGTCIVPLSRHSKYANGYVRYDPPGRMLNMQPVDDHVRKEEEFLIVTDHPQYPKLGFDSMIGWLAYHSPNDLLFVKSFPTYPDRAYNEVAGLTISIWYPDKEMVELEPIGPRERLEKKGDSASFTETWYLMNQAYESEIDPKKTAKTVKRILASGR